MLQAIAQRKGVLEEVTMLSTKGLWQLQTWLSELQPLWKKSPLIFWTLAFSHALGLHMGPQFLRYQVKNLCRTPQFVGSSGLEILGPALAQMSGCECHLVGKWGNTLCNLRMGLQVFLSSAFCSFLSAVSASIPSGLRGFGYSKRNWDTSTYCLCFW